MTNKTSDPFHYVHPLNNNKKRPLSIPPPPPPMNPTQTSSPSSRCPQPLLLLSTTPIAIYPHKIVQYPKTHSNKLTSVSNITLPSLQDIEQIQKVVEFGNNDIAFRIDQKEKRVRIVKIKKVEGDELDFVVQKECEMVIVKEVLRRKLCQLGFYENYELIKQLGKGATAKVCLAQRKSDRKKFAAKIISLKNAQNRQYQSFINETKLLRYMKNRYVVTIESLYISKKELICVLEYLQGGTLLEELKQDVIKTSFEKLKAIRDITEGLEHLRQKRIVHRDLKLENIMVRINEDKSKDYVITDFGLATWIGEKELIYEKCGTPGYIAPEILQANKTKVIVAHSSDIFSLGVLYHFILLTRAVFPFKGNPKELLILNKKAQFDLNSRHHQNLLIAEAKLLEVTLALDLNKRVSTRQLLDVYIREYEKDLASIKKKKIKVEEKGLKTNQEGSSRIARFKEGNSIQTIEKRAPSIQRSQTNPRVKTEPKEPQHSQSKKEGSVNKLFNKIWRTFSPSKPQAMKKKEDTSERRKHMKTYLF